MRSCLKEFIAIFIISFFILTPVNAQVTTTIAATGDCNGYWAGCSASNPCRSYFHCDSGWCDPDKTGYWCSCSASKFCRFGFHCDSGWCDPDKITPTITPTGTEIPTPTPVGGSDTQRTTLILTVGLDGIGTTGDNQNPTDANCVGANDQTTCGSNKNPKRPVRDVTVELYTDTDAPVHTFQTQMSYEGSLLNLTTGYPTGKFVGAIDLGTNFSGTYVVKVKSPGYLKRTVPNAMTIQPRTDITFYGNLPNENLLPLARLVTGNVNQDSALDIQDYNLLMSCSIYSSDDKGACNQQSTYATLADLDDNGTIDQLDYALFMREWVNQTE